MPVIAKCEEGLLVDVFGETKTLKCELYAVGGDTLAVYYDNVCTCYNLTDMKTDREIKFDNCMDIQISPNGSILGLLSTYKNLTAYNKSEPILEKSNVKKFGVSNMYVCCTSSEGLSAYTSDGKLVYETDAVFTNFFVFDKYILVASSKSVKTGKHQVFKIDSTGPITILEMESILGARFKYDDSTGNALLWMDTSYVSDCYYPESVLYFYNTHKAIRVRNCPKIHFAEFFGDGFVVCYGNQPSEVVVFDFSCRPRLRYPKGPRNRAFHASKGGLVAFCGFDNMSGDIEIYKSGEKITKFNVLGASFLHWMPSSSYFIVSTTNAFREDNNITMYDYYGRCIASRKFLNLESSMVYGKDEPFVEIERPAKLNIATYEKYIPPIFGKAPKVTVKSKTPPKVVSKRTRENVAADLRQVDILKEKIRKGENLNMSELNLILSEAKLQSELQNLK